MHTLATQIQTHKHTLTHTTHSLLSHEKCSQYNVPPHSIKYILYCMLSVCGPPKPEQSVSHSRQYCPSKQRRKILSKTINNIVFSSAPSLPSSFECCGNVASARASAESRTHRTRTRKHIHIQRGARQMFSNNVWPVTSISCATSGLLNSFAARHRRHWSLATAARRHTMPYSYTDVVCI